MKNEFNDFLRNYVYEPVDLCACYEPIVFPPDDFWDEPQNPFCGVIERKIGNTWYIIKTECDGNETLADKVKRLIFSEKGASC